MNNHKNELIDTLDSSVTYRRRFLRSACAVAACAPVAALLGSSVGHAKSTGHGHVPMISANEASPLQGEVAKLDPMASRRLHLFNEHLGESVDVTYYAYGIFRKAQVSELNHLMRDRRMNLARQMDTTLYDLLFMIRNALGTEEPVHILSGYRTPETNARLRRRSPRVAKYSLHMEGRAADIYIPGFSVKQVHETALSLLAGGVGLYSKSNFVHIDTGQVRHWGA